MQDTTQIARQSILPHSKLQIRKEYDLNITAVSRQDLAVSVIIAI
jgi:hypothetical protein